MATPARLDALIGRIRAARVGGAFWAPPIADADGPILVLRPTSRAEADRMVAHHGAADSTLLVLPDAPWASTIEADAIRIVRGEFDPWSVLRPGTRLVASPEDEWSLLAGIAGAERMNGVIAPDGLIAETVYRDPYDGRAIDAEAAVSILAEWRRQIDRNRAIVVASGMAWWKKQAIERFLWAGRSQALLFEDDPAKAVGEAQARGGAIACWPAKAPAVAALAARSSVPQVAIEDGFVRSVGLGAALHPPLSIVVDAGGIYYDPASASDLEAILETADMPTDLLERAARIRTTIVERGISKYASDAPIAAAAPRARRTVLVAGQVEDDASVRLGGGGVAGNLDLLARARAAEPDALILFKPHPDVDAGHRRGRVPDAELLIHADQIVRGEAMPALLARIDAVHVLSSLTGFEALLRGLEVVVHGNPFYAGWGLTTDLGASLPKRSRRLTLDMLVAGALILYPLYLDPVTGMLCPPEILLDRLAKGWRPRWNAVIALRGAQGKLARMLGTWTSGPR